MAEHDSDREDREPDEKGVPFDENAAWAAIVAGYGDEPPDPPGTEPYRPVRDLALPEPEESPEESGEEDRGTETGGASRPGGPLGSSISFAPGVGPRDYRVSEASEASDDDLGEDDEGHFVPPEPPPLPAADTTAKFAWLGVVGGPILLLLAILLGWEMTWWLATLGIGGFLGGFVTLVTRMRTDDDEDDGPGSGAVV
ncbi:hypothetical protein [Streptomyces sp. V3I7]|uniref:hypothetical protein n=1 Tax=Streptomyces sp. V3I7 TaxID=3042278 RepID=UPI00278073BB|nr:hypothetical protein [Streptomyces sp. V3I7]MDQ0990417.1 hypothetical protein [Streptomyces sp. V3I7]